ncbi:MAG TPA: GHKL domain-containing protein, partial [Subdoligranulum sp.]|nr:GHKL domain-containing protein [Subdoligranulum sp.]
VLILTVQHEQLREAALHSELTAMDNVLRRQYEQYRQSKENIRLINRRYHELKMQIAAIRAERDQAKQDAALAEMESGIRQYEAENKTGNPVLDTLLTAKTLYCQQHGINLTCVADGTLLHFLTTGEICTIVGTVLDNATESVLTEPDPEKRLIRAAIYAQNGFVMLRFENYCADPVELGPDGLPARSSHGGYDLKSVRAAAEAHGGTLTLHWENEWFTVRILLPQK